MALVPADCSSGGGGTPGPDVEALLLCDVLNGEIVGTAVGVYEYDGETGLPIGPPTFVDPVTGDPYVPQGTLQACLGGDSCAYVTAELLCDNVADGVYTPYVLNQVWNCDGTLLSSSTRDLSGAGYIPIGVPGACPDNTPVFAGFVCDNFGGSPEVPATPPTCPGSPLGAPLDFTPGVGMTEGPAGTYTQSSNSNASLLWQRSPSDDQRAICSVKFVNDPSTGDAPFWQLIGTFVDINGNTILLDAVWITAIEAALGVGDVQDIPAGSSASAVAGSTNVTITFDGPSDHSEMFASNGAFFVRVQDGDGLAAGVTLDFDPPIQSFQLALNNINGDPGSISGIQESAAAPGTAAIPASPPAIFTVKQFRNPDGTSFYENLDGTNHPVLGSIGDCGEFFQEQLCDATGAAFIRLYTIASGSVSGFQDYDLEGATFAAAAPVGRCAEILATFRHTPAEVLCYTAADGVTITQFLRRYLVNQDAVGVVAVIDTLLDGVTPFVTAIGGTVALCASSTGSDTGCTTASAIGQICYTPPPFVPAVFMTDDWAGSAVVGANGGPQTITNSDFNGFGRVVTMSLSKGAGLTGAAVLLGVAPTVANALYSQHLDLGGDVTGLSITFNSFGTLGNEILRNFSVPFDTLVGAGSAVAGNTGVNPTANNGTVTLTWNGPLADLDFEWRSQDGGTLSTISTVSFTTVATGSSTATVGTAAVLLDCETGAITYRDLATGAVVDLDDITIVDCVAAESVAPTLTSQARLLTAGQSWTPGADVVGVLTGVSFTVLSGTATLTDENGTVSAGLPPGLSAEWQVEDLNTLVGPDIIAAVGGNTFVTWTVR